MKTTRVNRYNCDHCDKRGYSAGHMSTHEKHCTASPKRECRMCELCDETQKPIEDLLAVLPLPTGWVPFVEEDGESGIFTSEHPQKEEWCKLANEGLERLQELTTCPACILAAVRQRGIAGYCDFDFKKERDELWTNIRDAQECDRDLANTWL